MSNHDPTCCHFISHQIHLLTATRFTRLWPVDSFMSHRALTCWQLHISPCFLFFDSFIFHQAPSCWQRHCLTNSLLLTASYLTRFPFGWYFTFRQASTCWQRFVSPGSHLLTWLEHECWLSRFQPAVSCMSHRVPLTLSAVCLTKYVLLAVSCTTPKNFRALAASYSTRFPLVGSVYGTTTV